MHLLCVAGEGRMLMCCSTVVCGTDCRYYGGEEDEPTEPAKKRWWIF